MKKIVFLFMVLTLASLPAVSLGDPTQSWCLNCHPQDSYVVVSANTIGCVGSTAYYTITVSNTFDGLEGWAVFDSGINVANGYGTFGTVILIRGDEYMVAGVSDAVSASFPPLGRSNYVPPFIASCPVVCTDGDNDGYAIQGGSCGPVDCDDLNPAVNPGAAEICTGGADEDCDTLIDCADVSCSADTACVPVEICTDGIDNDGDLYIDCFDTDCRYDGACAGRELCYDGIDNDGDRKIDCKDRDCSSYPACIPSPEICNDGIDNDVDGKIDCKDRDCFLSPYCK